MTPDFCKGCASLDESGGCSNYKRCARWRAWFRCEWASILNAAALIKEGRRNGKD